MFRTALLLLAFAVTTSSAAAADICEIYKNSFPFLYDAYCKGFRKPHSIGAGSTFAEGFNISPASLPTESTAYGIEMIGSYIRTNPGSLAPNFAIVKGFHKIGTGISTSGGRTFYSNDVVQRARGTPLLQNFQPVEDAKARGVPNLNVGTSFQLASSKSALPTALGLSLRYNQITNTVGGGPGILFNPSLFSFGFGLTREKVSNGLPGIYFFNALAGIRLGFVDFEYIFLKNGGGYPLDPIHIGTLSLNFGKLVVSAAVRHLNFYQVGEHNQWHFSVQYLFGKHFSAGALYNYFPGANSLAMQLFL